MSESLLSSIIREIQESGREVTIISPENSPTNVVCVSDDGDEKRVDVISRGGCSYSTCYLPEGDLAPFLVERSLFLERQDSDRSGLSGVF